MLTINSSDIVTIESATSLDPIEIDQSGAVPPSVVPEYQRFPKLSREEAYMIASVAVDYHVTQVVDGTKGIDGMIPKSIFVGQ